MALCVSKRIIIKHFFHSFYDVNKKYSVSHRKPKQQQAVELLEPSFRLPFSLTQVVVVWWRWRGEEKVIAQTLDTTQLNLTFTLFCFFCENERSTQSELFCNSIRFFALLVDFCLLLFCFLCVICDCTSSLAYNVTCTTWVTIYFSLETFSCS